MAIVSTKKLPRYYRHFKRRLHHAITDDFKDVLVVIPGILGSRLIRREGTREITVRLPENQMSATNPVKGILHCNPGCAICGFE